MRLHQRELLLLYSVLILRLPRRLRLDCRLLSCRERNQHRNPAAILAILLAKESHQIALFEVNADKDVTGGRDGKEQVSARHHWRRPEGEDKSQVDRMPHEAVQRWCRKLLLAQLSATEVRINLLDAEQAEVADQARADEHGSPTEHGQ